jgi:hypothetical protein
VGLLIIVEAISVYFLWALNPVTQAGEAVFAVFLSIDLVSFTMISYIYRKYKSGEQFSNAFLIGACVTILILVYVSHAI